MKHRNPFVKTFYAPRAPGNGDTKSRRDHTAPVCAIAGNRTSHTFFARRVGHMRARHPGASASALKGRREAPCPPGSQTSCRRLAGGDSSEIPKSASKQCARSRSHHLQHTRRASAVGGTPAPCRSWLIGRSGGSPCTRRSNWRPILPQPFIASTRVNRRDRHILVGEIW